MLKSLNRAKEIFEATDEETFSYLINLTDGATSNPGASYEKLIELEESGIKIYDILLGMNNKAAFSKDGKDAGTIYEDITTEELTEIYDEIYGEICSEVINNSTGDFKETGKNYFTTGNNMYMFLDQELLQGAKLQIEYVINIKVAFDCSKVEIQCNMDDKLSFDESAKMLTEDKTNADYKWGVNEGASYKDGNNKVLSICEEAADAPYVIKKGKRYEPKLVLSCLLTAKDDTNYANAILFRLNGEDDLTYGL